jgi:hypothetical protein
MTKGHSSDRVLELERGILRAICSSSRLAPDVLADAMRNLRGHAWRNEEHRVVYAALMRVSKSGAASAAEQLPAQATRMGFPEVNWELYLCAREEAAPDVPALIRELRAAEDEGLL